MRFDLSDDQREIQGTARELLAARAGWPQVREHAEARTLDEALWSELSELGWPGIAVAEEHGGLGLGMVELCVLGEELGATVAPVPLLGSALAALVLEDAGSADEQAEHLPGLAAGEVRGALAPVGQLAPDAGGAALVVTADPAETAAALAGPEAITAIDAIDPTRSHGTADAVAGETLVGDVATGLHRATIAVSAELVGVCRRSLEMTVAYVRERKQFGVPVGGFQAVQHAAALMLRDTEAARVATYHAAWAADAAPERLAGAAAMAKAAASDAGRSVTAAAVQLHGGIGFTWEADVHWLLKRAQVDAAFLGAGGTHRARLAAAYAAERSGAPA